MNLLSIGLKGTTETIKQALEAECDQLAQAGFCMGIEIETHSNYTFLGVNLLAGELSFRNYEKIKATLKTCVSHILASWIIVSEEPRMIQQIIARDYFYLNPAEREIVNSHAVRSLADTTTRQQLITTRILDYLENHHELILDGFLHFRLQDYCLQLSEVIEKAVDDLLLELEYKEFIQLLRYFVDVQEPREEEAHLVLSSNNRFSLFDAHGQLLTNSYNDNLPYLHKANDACDSFTGEDLLISTLITMAPRHIMIHSADPQKDKDLLDTITNVFDNRAILCNGCELCTGKYAGKSHNEF